MDLNSPESWRWIWFVMALVFAAGEMATPATFFFLPFAIGCGAAAIATFLGASVEVGWAIFLVVSIVSFISLWKLGRKMERNDEAQEGVGATRWVGQEATVTRDITEKTLGLVRLEREEWRAESLTGDPIRKGTTVVIERIAGTRLVVVPVDESAKDLSETINPSDPNGVSRGAK